MAQRQFRTDDTSLWLDRFGEGSQGALTVAGNTTHGAQTATCTGTLDSTSLTASSGAGFGAGYPVFIHQTKGSGAGAWELNKISSIGGGTNWTMVYPLTNTYSSGAQVIHLLPYSSIQVNSGVSLSAPAWNGSTGGILPLLCSGLTQVEGWLYASGLGFRGGAGTWSNEGTGYTGESHPGLGSHHVGSPNGNVSPTNAGGGQGGGKAQIGSTAGGGGSYGTEGTNASNSGNDTSNNGNGGVRGSTYGQANLVAMHLGSGGGGGFRWEGGTSANRGGNGGAAGGAIFLISRQVIITGRIYADGANGSAGNSSQGGGAGSGGSILIKGQNIALGSSLVSSVGGSGGGPGGGGGGTGGNGGSGRIHIDYSDSLTGTSTPTLDSSVDSVFIDPDPQNYTLLL